MFYKCFTKKSSGSAFKIEIMPNQDLHKPVVRKFEEQKVH